jgi:phosphatidylglycerol:prolipoprotein diacylglycerol transferase
MGIQIGPLFIRYYGMILMLGVVAAAWLSARNARLKRLNSEIVWDGLIWVIIGGVIGARVWHILTPPPSMVEQGITAGYYLTHPLDAIAIWRGGLGVPGAILGGLITMYWFSRRQNLNFLVWVDIVAPALALGQAIGRWGNFVNQELYGSPTDLPWGIRIEPQYRLPGYGDQATFHPLFLYESLWNLGNMFFLLWLGRRFAHRLKSGDLFIIYLIIYPLGRFLLEFIRLDPAMVAGVNANQTLMGVVAILAAGVLLYRHREDWRSKGEPPKRRRRKSTG